jgi:hypothetical protein
VTPVYIWVHSVAWPSRTTFSSTSHIMDYDIGRLVFSGTSYLFPFFNLRVASRRIIRRCLGWDYRGNWTRQSRVSLLDHEYPNACLYGRLSLCICSGLDALDQSKASERASDSLREIRSAWCVFLDENDNAFNMRRKWCNGGKRIPDTRGTVGPCSTLDISTLPRHISGLQRKPQCCFC